MSNRDMWPEQPVERKSVAYCRTCGSPTDAHRPSQFDPMGISDPAHKLQDYVMPREQDLHVHVCSCGQMATTRFMTGQEWYDKFTAEYSVLLGMSVTEKNIKFIVDSSTAVEAAKKAAGIE